MQPIKLITLFSVVALASSPAFSATQREPTRSPATLPQAPPPPYAMVADLVLRSPIVLDSVIRSVVRLKGAQAVGVPTGKTRLYVEADVRALVRGPHDVPARIGWVLDVPLGEHGRVPRLAKQHVLVFARPIKGFTAQIQLTGDSAMLDWTPAADARTRAVIKETLAPDAPPRITGIGHAFHVAGALSGEGETQIFLGTEDSRPVSLSVLRRPGEQPRWAVALSDIVDEAAAPPAPDTLLWYRLACGLPPALPDSAVEGLSPADQAAARRDYALVLDSLGPCVRSARAN